MRAILVCVDYSDLLGITLPYNRHHFNDVCVVTSLSDSRTKEVARENGAKIFETDLFYRDGAVFNKWRALEAGLDWFGRKGWLCIMDADILWPKYLPKFPMRIGQLYTPRRRMFEDLTQPIPQEPYWARSKLHRNETEFAGYSQIFHGSDSALPTPPWHETDWTHAGGADSFFQARWNPSDKIRPPFDVLHLGEAGRNWCGRVTPYLDGSIPEEAGERSRRLSGYYLGRTGKAGESRFSHEKLPGNEKAPSPGGEEA